MFNLYSFNVASSQDQLVLIPVPEQSTLLLVGSVLIGSVFLGEYRLKGKLKQIDYIRKRKKRSLLIGWRVFLYLNNWQVLEDSRFYLLKQKLKVGMHRLDSAKIPVAPSS